MVSYLELGWQSGRLIYYNGGQNAIDAYDPHDGSSRFVTSGLPRTTDGSDTFDNPLYHQDAGLSPDGQVLVVRTSRYQKWVLSGSRLQHAPPFIDDVSIYWVGLGHAALGETQGVIAIIDMLSGAVQRTTGIASTNVYAMAGAWAVVSVNAGGAYFHVINYTTGADHPLGGYAGDGDAVFSLGTTRFLLHHRQSPGDTYIIDPASLAG